MADVQIIEIVDGDSFELVPPCADGRFDHRTCDYWEDADRGSKLHRPAWLKVAAAPPPARPEIADNPFAPVTSDVDDNPFLPASAIADDNPFAPVTRRERPQREGVPRKLGLLDRGRGVFGSYAKVLLADGEPAAYCQFGPLSAYPRASRLRELYPQLPASPLPAVITCISSTSAARGAGHARRLVDDVCRDLSERGFAAVEAYPDLTRPTDETSAARPGFWHTLGFSTAVDDERYPVMRREL
jgi:ribosomal protein S18 acetylase RimI-like enzyme